MQDPNSGDPGLEATLAHAARCFAKAATLRRQAKEAVTVAVSMAATASPDAVAAAVDYAREHEIPGRAALVAEWRRRSSIDACAPGSSRVRERHAGADDPWPPRNVPLVYVLWGESEVLYIGSTINVRGRMPAHSRKPWVRAHLHFCADEASARQLEADLIYQHQPTLNAAGRRRRLRIA